MTRAERFGALIKSLREAKRDSRGRKTTQLEVAEAIGIGRSTLADLERGRDLPGRETMFALLKYFDQPVSVLKEFASEAPQDSEFTEDPTEIALLRFWRKLDDSQAELFLRLLGAQSIPAGGSNVDHVITPDRRRN